MTDDSAGPGPLRFDVLAALVDHDPALSDQVAAWTRRGGEPFSAAGAALLEAATQDERDLAVAICGPDGALADGDAAAVAGLLRLAAASPMRSALAIGLREAFLDDEPANRATTFAGVYKRLALPALDGDAREQATVILGRLGQGA